MLKIERQRYITKKLQTDGGILISDVAKEFNCSEETIRRDLKEMEKDNKLIRIHGGAYLPETDEKNIPIALREIQYPHEKKHMAQLALSHYISAHDTIMLDSSTTCFTLAKEILISELAVTIITNSHSIAQLFARTKSQVKLMLIGGRYNERSNSYNGPQSVAALNDYVADKTFISCPAIDYQYGLLDRGQAEANVRKRMIEKARQIIVLADHTKLGDRGEFVICELARISALVTDYEPSPKWKQALSKKGIELKY